MGTHSVQRLLEVLCQPLEKKLVYESIIDKITDLAYDVNGSFVLTALLPFFNSGDSRSFHDEILERLLPLLSDVIYDQLGVCIVNKMISTAHQSSHITHLI